MPLPSDDCDECVPNYSSLDRRRVAPASTTTIFFSSLPFVLTFLVVATLVLQRLFPYFSRDSTSEAQDLRDAQSQQHPSTKFQPNSNRKTWLGKVVGGGTNAKRLAGLTFAANIALSAVLVELLLCEISNTLNPAARSWALRATLSSLVLLLIIVAPALEIYSVLNGSGLSISQDTSRRQRRMIWVLEGSALILWLLAFWYLGAGLLGQHTQDGRHERLGDGLSGAATGVRRSFSEGCLKRIGIIGISLMAALAGFAAVSSLWQTFGVKDKPVTDSDIGRKQAGLDATRDMLSTKRSRLRALEHKLSDAPAEGFMTRMMGSIRGNASAQERQALTMEISGLETMATSLSNSLTTLQTRRANQLRSKTSAGRAFTLFSYGFSFYCLYRIGATSLTTLHRIRSPGSSFSNSDPINNILALLARHWDPTLDRAAWSRQISFLLSGVMLLASFNSALQTFLLFGRLAPGILRHAQANMALLISQVSATYVISSALLLRSNLPSEVGSVISDALGAPLEPGFVESWFEGWFLAVSCLTAVGILVSRKVRSSGGWDDDDDYGEGGGDVEMGKMN